GCAYGRGRHHLPVPRPALPPPGTMRGAQETHLAASVSRPRRTSRPAAYTVLRPAAGRAPPSGRTPGQLAIARMRPRLGWDLDLGLFPGLCLARPWCRAAAGDGELCAQPEPVLRPAAVHGSRQLSVATSGYAR